MPLNGVLRVILTLNALLVNTACNFLVIISTKPKDYFYCRLSVFIISIVIKVVSLF